MPPRPAGGARQSGVGRFDAGGRRRIRLVGMSALLLSLIVLIQVGIERPRDGVFDLYQRLMPRPVDRLWARIVEIDEASLHKYGPWPWPRFHMADLAQAIFDKGALAIGFDIVFPERDRYGAEHLLEIYPDMPEDLRAELMALPDPDRAFARTIGRLPVVLARSGVADSADAGPRDWLLRTIETMPRPRTTTPSCVPSLALRP